MENTKIMHANIKDRGCHTHCLECMHGNQWCCPCRWKSILQTTSAKERVYGEVAAEAIAINTDLLPYAFNRSKALYSTKVATKPLQNHKRDDIYIFPFALWWFSIDSDAHLHLGVERHSKFPYVTAVYVSLISCRSLGLSAYRNPAKDDITDSFSAWQTIPHMSRGWEKRIRFFKQPTALATPVIYHR